MEGTCREVTCLWFPPWAFYLDVHQPGLIPGCFQMIPRGRAGSRGVQGSAASCSSSHVSPFHGLVSWNWRLPDSGLIVTHPPGQTLS